MVVEDVSVVGNDEVLLYGCFCVIILILVIIGRVIFDRLWL